MRVFNSETHKHTEALPGGYLPLISATMMEDIHLPEFSPQNFMSQLEAKLQIGAQVTLAVGNFAFLSPHNPRFSGDMKVNILWNLKKGSPKS